MANKDRLHLKAKKAVDSTPAAAHEVKNAAKAAWNKPADDVKTGAQKGSSHPKSTGHQATSKKR